MKIIMLSGTLPPRHKGGVAHQVSRLSQALVERGHEVIVKTFSPSPPSIKYQLVQIRSPMPLRENKLWRMTAAPVSFATGRYGKYDVVHAHGDNPLLYRRRIPVIRTFYGSAREEARTAERLRRRLSQRLFIASEVMGKKLATVTVGISENTSTSHRGLDYVIPCGVDRRLFRPGKKSRSPSVLFVGTLSGRKRGRLVVDIFKEVIQPNFKDAELWLVAESHVEGEGIKSFGSISDKDVAALFSAAWIFILPSSYEGFGVPYIEAMASGTPVVATPNPGALELVRPQTGGVIVPEKDIGTAICNLLGDGEKRVWLSTRGREASAAFDWTMVAERYERIYEDAILRTRRRDPSEASWGSKSASLYYGSH